jgi:hypothetical protein
LPAETKEAYISSLIEMKRCIEDNDGILDGRAIFFILDHRENMFLQIISEYKNPLVVLVFGGIHAFGGEQSFGKHYYLKDRLSLIDNIYYWNKYHPDKKISLIEIIPENY